MPDRAANTAEDWVRKVVDVDSLQVISARRLAKRMQRQEIAITVTMCASTSTAISELETVRPTARPSVLPALTGLRFFAAVAVVIHHYCLAFVYPVLPLTPPIAILAPLWMIGERLLQNANTAVDFFFVLSGFILIHAYVTESGTVRGGAYRFFAARFARLYPVYFLGFVLGGYQFVANRFFLPHPLQLEFTTLALVQTWFPAPPILWNPPSWTLSNEAVFYALFPYLAPIVARRSTRWILIALPTLACIGIVGPHLYQWLFMPHPDNYWGIHPFIRLDEFVLGLCVGVLYRRRILDTLPCALSVVRLAPYLALGLALIVPNAFVWGVMGLPFALMILGVAARPSGITRLCSTPSLVILGEASYALYILHWPLLWISGIIWPQLIGSGLPFLCVSVMLTVSVSIGVYYGLERPARSVLRRLLRA